MVEDFRKSALEYHEADPPGKLAIAATKPLAYSPGVAYACEEIARDPSAAARLK